MRTSTPEPAVTPGGSGAPVARTPPSRAMNAISSSASTVRSGSVPVHVFPAVYTS